MQINMLKTIKYQNRKFAIDYFKMLGKYFQRIIKKWFIFIFMWLIRNIIKNSKNY